MLSLNVTWLRRMRELSRMLILASGPVGFRERTRAARGAAIICANTPGSARGGMTLRVYQIKLATKTLRAWTYEMPDGKLEQYEIAVQE